MVFFCLSFFSAGESGMTGFSQLRSTAGRRERLARKPFPGVLPPLSPEHLMFRLQINGWDGPGLRRADGAKELRFHH